MMIITLNFKIVCPQALPAELSFLGLLRHFSLMVYGPECISAICKISFFPAIINMYNF
jgi:hypothetical protein